MIQTTRDVSHIKVLFHEELNFCWCVIVVLITDTELAIFVVTPYPKTARVINSA